jgi:putative ABC transport system permease protein
MTMWSLFKLAFRNIFRFKRRTFITFSAVSIGLALLIVIISLMNGIDKQSINNIVNSETSHIKIFRRGYFVKMDEVPMNLTIEDPDEIREWLKDKPEIRQMEKRILFGASLIKGVDELPCLGVAMEPALDPLIFNIKASLLEGSWLESGSSKILIGKDLADDVALKVGDLVTIRMISSSSEESFSWNALDMEVGGIFETGNPNTDGQVIILPLAQTQQALSMGSQVTEIVVRLNVRENTDPKIEIIRKDIEKTLTGKGADIEVFSWKELAGEFLVISKMKTKNSSMIILIMLIIASMGIANTMLMAVLERTREIGMFSAMGMKKSEILLLFLFEGGLIGVLGSMFACILGGLGSWYLEVHGWKLGSGAFSDITASFYPLKNVFYADLTVNVLFMTFIYGTAIALITSFYPALKAARMNPVDALRHI